MRAALIRQLAGMGGDVGGVTVVPGAVGWVVADCNLQSRHSVVAELPPPR